MSAAVKMRRRLVFDDQDALDELLELDEEDDGGGRAGGVRLRGDIST